MGILLCTRKGDKMVEYALAGMDNNLFVSTYMLSLPDKKTLQDFLIKKLANDKGTQAEACFLQLHCLSFCLHKAMHPFLFSPF